MSCSSQSAPKSLPPRSSGPLARREARLAWGLMSPTLISVALVVVLPLLAIFWISVKPISLGDLRPTQPNVYERLKGKPKQAGDLAIVEYRLKNSSPQKSIGNVRLKDQWPVGLEAKNLDERCVFEADILSCSFGDWAPAYREKLQIEVVVGERFLADQTNIRKSKPIMTGEASSVLLNDEFTLENFTRVFSGSEFLHVLWATLFYTIVGTVGALVVGLMAALILNISFTGQGVLRGLFLFPYVAPVVAVAFTWVTLLDPFSGSANALLVQMELIDAPINFFGERPLALIMVTVFEIWRYFPMAFLFILARMQAIDTDMYEAADMDGATPFQKFWYLSLPQLLGILSVLFLLRFIWTFNKFDDIFLLTGGNAGTRTLTVNVYEQAFAISNIGAGAAVAVVVFGCLLLFSVIFFRFISQEEGL